MADFIMLEASTRALSRLLTGDSSEDDDFAHLEGVGGRSHSSVGVAGQTPEAPVAYDYGAAGDAASGSDYYGTQSSGNRPLLSPTAEAALMQLSTNFLLYVAMVLITVLVAKVYFPSWLAPREEGPAERRSSRHRYMDVMQDAYKSDLSDEEGDDEGEEDPGNAGRGDGAPFLDADAEIDDETGYARTKSRMSRSRSSSFLFEYDQEEESKRSVYTNLAICAVMLNVTFVSWGLLQVGLDSFLILRPCRCDQLTVANDRSGCSRGGTPV